MTGAVITVDDGAVLAALKRLVVAGRRTEPALKNIGEALAASTKNRIRDGVTPAGVRFAPLNPEYAKTKKGPGILRGESLTLSRIVWQLAGDGVEVGTNAIYGAIHQFGGTIRPKTASALVFKLGGRVVRVKSVRIPARPFLGLSKDDREEVLAILADHFEDTAGATGNPAP